MSITQAHHDLNGVRVIKISGWKGLHNIVPQPTTDEHWVTIRAPQRHEGEFWTFSAARDGVLTCFTSLLGSPSLLTESRSPLVIRLPVDRLSEIAVSFDD